MRPRSKRRWSSCPRDGVSRSSAPAPAVAGCGVRAPLCLRPPPLSHRRSSGRRADPRAGAEARRLACFRAPAVRPPPRRRRAAVRSRRRKVLPRVGVRRRVRAAPVPSPTPRARRRPGRSGSSRGALECCRATDEQEHDQRRDEKHSAPQALADFPLCDERDRAPSAHRSTSSRKSSASDGGP